MAFLRKYGTLSRFIRASKAMKVELSSDQSEAKLIFNGYTYGDLNRAGFIDPDKVASRCEGMRIKLWMDKEEDRQSLSNGKRLGVMAVADAASSLLIFMMSGHYHLEPAFFEPENFYHPIESTLSLCAIGKTSFQVQQTDVSTWSQKVLSVSTIVQILADRDTRRPVPLSIHESVEGRLRGTPIDRFSPENIPPGAHKLNTRFNWSDADYYYHINHASYIRLGVDAAAQAACEGRLPGIGPDLAKYWITDTHVLYSKEVNPGAELEVFSWTKPDNNSVVFSQTLQAGTPVFHMTLTLQPYD